MGNTHTDDASDWVSAKSPPPGAGRRGMTVRTEAGTARERAARVADNGHETAGPPRPPGGRERRRAEGILAGEIRVLELIAGGAPVDEALAVICKATEEHSPEGRCAVRVLADDNTPQASTQSFGHASLRRLPAEFPRDARQRCIVENIGNEPSLRNWGRRCNVRALWAEPVVGAGGQTLGTVVTAYAEARAPTEYELEAGTVAARLASIILERARADERARRQSAELAHVARLATMGEMASGLAHELNQPLCAIVNYTEACLQLLDGKSAPPELRQAIAEVAKQSERAGEVIRRLREFVRRREPRRVDVEVNAAVREVLGLMSTELRQHEVKVKLHLGQRLPPVLADPIQIQQVLVNLVRNAVDAMAETGRERRSLRIRTCRRGSFLELRVQDAGRGISAEAGERVFDSFFTTKPHGLGMGLSISRTIIELHEGRIWATPNPSVGVTFHITLPLARRTRDGRAERDRVRRG